MDGGHRTTYRMKPVRGVPSTEHTAEVVRAGKTPINIVSHKCSDREPDFHPNSNRFGHFGLREPIELLLFVVEACPFSDSKIPSVPGEASGRRSLRDIEMPAHCSTNSYLSSRRHPWTLYTLRGKSRSPLFSAVACVRLIQVQPSNLSPK